MADERPPCPICDGHLAAEGIKVSLETNIAVIDGSIIPLQRRQADVLFILAQRPHVYVSIEELDSKTFGGKEGARTAYLYEIIKSLRKTLEESRWHIITMKGGCGGYMLTRDMLADVNPDLINTCTELLERIGLGPEETDQTVRSILSKLKS